MKTVERGTRLVRGNEPGAAAYGFWICGGWRRMRRRQMKERVFVVSPARGVVAATNFSGYWAFSR
ncbi:hypothetical protein H5410_063723 [Solanum commersonii]|uniref:Uncharacterized protein n=1 Tax=Solanum commersonii TaxID=4109 RepID=A0A9J5WEP3_SOLCO|nr:hypothetical protein H5410_063723 [Solanum commersonii]